MAHQLLDRSDVSAGSEHVGCKRVSERVARDGLGDSSPTGSRLDRPLQGRGMEVVPSAPAGPWVRRVASRGEDELPGEVVAGGWTLAVHGVWQLAPPSPSIPVRPVLVTHLVQMLL